MIRHQGAPGPLYWDYRCVICGEDMDDRRFHRPWWKRWGR